MTKEIKRNSWSSFCRMFSVENQYRPMNISISRKSKKEDRLVCDSPFMGLVLEKKGRLIDGIQLFAGWEKPDHISHPILSMREPTKVMLEKDNEGTDIRLKVKTKDGAEATIELTGQKNPYQQRSFVEKVAYSIYEQHGHSHGNDANDWIEAEKLVKDAEKQFV